MQILFKGLIPNFKVDNSESENSEDSELYEQLACKWILSVGWCFVFSLPIFYFLVSSLFTLSKD